jgi:DNA-binding transcriptional ArsR family regulator
MQSTELSTVFSALADPTRRAILARLSKGEAPVKDLAEPFALSGPAITKHLNVLERAGLISRRRDGQRRPCRLEPRALEPAADWIERYRAMWEERLDRLDAFLKSAAPKPAARAPVPATKKPARKSPKTTQAKGRRHGIKK